jgi:hypothetical protein
MAKTVGRIIECWIQSIYKVSTIESIIAVWMLVGAYEARSSTRLANIISYNYLIILVITGLA